MSDRQMFRGLNGADERLGKSWEQQGAACVGLQPVSGHSPDLVLQVARPDTYQNPGLSLLMG